MLETGGWLPLSLLRKGNRGQTELTLIYIGQVSSFGSFTRDIPPEIFHSEIPFLVTCNLDPRDQKRTMVACAFAAQIIRQRHQRTWFGSPHLGTRDSRLATR